MRVGLLADFLKDQGFSVTVVSVGRSEREIDLDGIIFRELRFPSNHYLLALYAAMILFSRLLRWQGLQAWLYYNFYQVDKKFVRLVRGLASEAGTTLLEYPFWSRLTDPVRTQTILTNHDIIAKSWTNCGNRWLNSILYKNLLHKEIEAIRSVNRIVFVAESDREFFLEHGVDQERTAVITNPMMLPLSVPDDNLSPQQKHEFCGTAFQTGALFVGSGWYPNREAAQAIVTTIAPASPEVTFFIAGDCSKWVKRAPANVRLLGIVSAHDLSTLYHMITFALIPVGWGTGSSLKTVEAMAYGKVIVSTPIGVRGLMFEHGVHGIICSDIKGFSAAINELMKDQDYRGRLKANARNLAKQYDYRTIYMNYLEIINGLPTSS